MAARHWQGLAACVTIACLGACGAPDGRGSPERRPSPISEAVHAGGTALEFNVPCAPDLEVRLVAEHEDTVVLSATHLPPPDGIYPACLEGYYVTLAAPLDDRALVDQSGNLIDVRQVGQLEATDGLREVDDNS